MSGAASFLPFNVKKRHFSAQLLKLTRIYDILKVQNLK